MAFLVWLTSLLHVCHKTVCMGLNIAAERWKEARSGVLKKTKRVSFARELGDQLGMSECVDGRTWTGLAARRWFELHPPEDERGGQENGTLQREEIMDWVIVPKSHSRRVNYQEKNVRTAQRYSGVARKLLQGIFSFGCVVRRKGR